MNSFTIQGRLVKDVESRDTSAGTIAKGTVVENVWQSGEEKALFHDFTVFGKQAERLIKVGNKGNKIFLTGSLSYRDVPDKNTGQNRRFYDINVNNFDIDLSGGKGKPAESSGSKQDPIEEDDIPF